MFLTWKPLEGSQPEACAESCAGVPGELGAGEGTTKPKHDCYLAGEPIDNERRSPDLKAAQIQAAQTQEEQVPFTSKPHTESWASPSSADSLDAARYQQVVSKFARSASPDAGLYARTNALS